MKNQHEGKDLRCKRCGKLKSQREKEPPMDTGINNYLYRYTTTFYSTNDGGMLCPECHKEKQLEDLMSLMNYLEKKGGENP